jgi:energy-converting hydrogenase Eha subunit F
MNPLPDRVVILGLLITLGLCFALVFWSVRLNPRPEPALQWRQNTAPQPLDRHPQPSPPLL